VNFNQDPLIELSDIVVSFGTQEVHKGISMSVFPSEIVVLLGPSGTGKTVLLKVIIGLITPKKGSAKVLGHNLEGISKITLQEIRKDIGMLFQGAALFDSLSVFENIAFPLRQVKNHSDSEIKKVVLEKLELVGLGDFQTRFPAELSGGQKKRVGLARALATSPKVILFDEPTTGLDPTSKELIDDLILTLKIKHQISSVVVTHDIDSAKKVADTIYLIAEGSVVVSGKATELWDKDENIVKFISGRWD
jgi:phospholipid/cholesterol/gamma-HCH transport system ATP-binding protein